MMMAVVRPGWMGWETPSMVRVMAGASGAGVCGA